MKMNSEIRCLYYDFLVYRNYLTQNEDIINVFGKRPNNEYEKYRYFYKIEDRLIFCKLTKIY